MNRTTLAVIDRWLKARRQIQEQQYTARMAVVAQQLREMRGTAA